MSLIPLYPLCINRLVDHTRQNHNLVYLISTCLIPRSYNFGYYIPVLSQFKQSIDGEFSIQNGDETVNATSGSYVFIPKGRPNAYKNIGKKEGKILILYTPPGAEKAFEELGIPISSNDQNPPSMEKMIKTIKRYGMEIKM